MSAAGGRQHLTPRAARQENARLQATENPDDGRESALRRLGSYHRNAYRSPWWARLCASGHVQTIIGSVFTVPLSPAYIRESWVAPDGHILAVDVLGTKETFSRGIVVLLHGLCGSSVNPLTCRQAHAFTDAGTPLIQVAPSCCNLASVQGTLHAAQCPLHRCNRAALSPPPIPLDRNRSDDFPRPEPLRRARGMVGMVRVE